MMEAVIVHFPHPGAEHNAKHKIPNYPWNTGKHQRKFMRSKGAYIDKDGDYIESIVNMWGEWEAPSRVEHEWKKEIDFPTYLHIPYWTRPKFTGSRQNTDPWIFGEYFLYSNCNQLNQASLRSLPIGSLILFGSTIRGEFALDTCLVVKDSSHMNDGSTDYPEAFSICTIESLESENISTAPFKVYKGASPKDTTGGMYSFSPCLPSNTKDGRFKRPIINLPGYINPESTQTPSGTKVSRQIGEVGVIWQSVIEQVRSQGLEIGVHFDMPSFEE